MRTYNTEEKEILKRVERDYRAFKVGIDLLVENGNTMEQILDFITRNIKCDITNCEFLDDFKYIDINYKDMTISILKNKDEPIHLGTTIEVWNDKKYEYIGLIEFDELKEIIK